MLAFHYNALLVTEPSSLTLIVAGALAPVMPRVISGCQSRLCGAGRWPAESRIASGAAGRRNAPQSDRSLCASVLS
jgi:hypothetical protein